MPGINEVRADYDATTIVIYQAYSAAIAAPAVKAQRFVPPFSTTRMTWIKPSFLWLMERSNWGQKTGQEHILAVRIKRSGWEEALSMGVLTSYQPGVHRSPADWRDDFEKAQVHVQWDPERSIRGSDLGINCIQVGLSRHIIEQFVGEWTVEIGDVSPLVRKIHALLKEGHAEKAKKLLPSESKYLLNPPIAKKLAISSR